MAGEETEARGPEARFISPRDGLLILGLQLVLLIFRLGQIPLLGPDEPRYARVAVEMARAHEWVRPTLGGEPWLEKPALYYWLAGLGYRVIGENEWAARLPAVLAALLMTGFTGLLGARLFGAGVGRTAMIILATSPLVFGYARAATMDMLVAAFITGSSALFILAALGIAGRSAVPAAWVLMGAAALAKGPIGILIPIGVAVALGLWLRRFSLAKVVTPLSVALLILVAGPWFFAIYVDQGRHFVEVFLLNHNLERFTSTIHNHPGPFYYYLPVLLLGVFPWTVLVIPAAPAFVETGREERAALLAWLLVPLALFSAAGSKLPGYILPCLPPFAIILALSARDIRSGARPGALRAAGLLGLVVSAALVALVIRGAQAGEVWGRAALVPTSWALASAFGIARAFDRARRQGLRVLTIAAAGLLLLVTLVAPPVLSALQSGRRLFIPAQGREVLVLGAWRTAWMSGYFYNDGRVREVDSFETLVGLVNEGPRLVMFGPSEWIQAERQTRFRVVRLAEGPHGAILARASPQTP